MAVWDAAAQKLGFVPNVMRAFAFRPKIEEWTVHPFERSAIASYIAVVAAVYLRSPSLPPQGAQWLADALLHYRFGG